MESQHNSAELQPAAKYSVFRALSDTLHAVGHNPLAFFVATIAAVIVAAAVLLAVSLLIGTASVAIEEGLISAGFGGFPVVSIAAYIVASTLGGGAILALVHAPLVAFIPLAVVDGADGRRGGVGDTLARGLRKVLRVAGANLLLALVLYGPIALAFLLLLIVIVLDTEGLAGEATVAPFLVLVASLAWTVIVLLRFSLAPYAALFEPETPLKHTLARSRHLLRQGGQWFLVKGFGLYVLVFLLLALITGVRPRDIENTPNLWLNLVILVVSVLNIIVLALLYRNRKAIKG